MDHHLRTLHRRAQTDPEDLPGQVAWLRSRLRAGELTRERLDVASYLGHAAAGLALGAGATPADLGCARGLVLGLKPYGPPVFARAAIGIAGLAPASGPEQQIIEPLRAWLRCPCRDHATRVPWVEHLADAMHLTARVVPHLLPRPAGPVFREEFCRPPHPLPPPVEIDTSGADRVIREAVARHVVPWALGLGDPALQDE